MRNIWMWKRQHNETKIYLHKRKATLPVIWKSLYTYYLNSKMFLSCLTQLVINNILFKSPYL